VRHYEERPEIEQDYEQMKSGGWQLKKLSSTRYSEIVFSLTTVVLSSSALSILKIRVPSIGPISETGENQGGFPWKKSILFA